MARFSKNRLFSRLIKQFNEDLTIKTESLDTNTRTAVSSAVDSATVEEIVAATAVDSATVAEIVAATAVDSASVQDIVASINDYVQLNQAGTLEATTGTIRWVAPKDITITSAKAVLGTAASGSDCVIVLKKNGTGMSTLTVSDGSDSATNSGLSTALVEGDYLTTDITTASGSDLNLIVEYTG